ncbi:MAG TPA: hypothetical protein VHE33_00180 [Acidobacteriaceae bacterium]|nr:hypothetical protein [Acidobacteriaceae bacterium]
MDTIRAGFPAYLYLASTQMPKKRVKKRTFSAVKAVKANARERVGQPKPERILPDAPREEKRGQKHPATLVKLLSEDE